MQKTKMKYLTLHQENHAWVLLYKGLILDLVSGEIRVYNVDNKDQLPSEPSFVFNKSISTPVGKLPSSEHQLVLHYLNHLAPSKPSPAYSRDRGLEAVSLCSDTNCIEIARIGDSTRTPGNKQMNALCLFMYNLLRRLQRLPPSTKRLYSDS
jgi:hypothetical protein